ncbi:MAG: SDR family oxidoreductase [Hyphomicrobiaceae bacterium]|nr:SDR family oxidoreductase [Hyphomicrobiaceae bacterium]
MSEAKADVQASVAGEDRRLLCIGLGYTAQALARRLQPRGLTIIGTSRSDSGCVKLTQKGFRGLVFDGGARSAALAGAIASATHVLVSVAPDANGDPVLRHHRDDLAAAPGLDWIGYLSTIGVYGDRGGAWVDETTLPAPGSERSRRRLAAETDWLMLGQSARKRVEIFRLPGIYGPGRSAIDTVRAGTARRLVKAGQVFNRMHVDDIAAALDAALSRPHAFHIYNLADDEPAPPEDVVAYAAGLLKVPPPPLEPFDARRLSPMAASFYAETKRVSNARAKASLGLRLLYPTYREGLAAIAGASS